jgi:hypothetical protein
MPTGRTLVALAVTLGLLFACMSSAASQATLASGSTRATSFVVVTGSATPGATLQATPEPFDTCVQSASCIGGGALSSCSMLLFAVACGIAALALFGPAPRRCSRFCASYFALPRGVTFDLLRPPQVV